MDIFGIGTSELVFILLIAIIVLGPKEMQKAGKTVGRWLNRMMRSDGWKAFQRASREIRNLPTNLMREANLEELREMDKDIRNKIDPHPPASRSPRQQTPLNQPSPASDTTDADPSASSEALPPADRNDPGQ